MGNLFTLLPTKMISKTYINDVKIDYEEYLTELLNYSMYFMSLTNDEKFERISSQAHGEADVKANSYELDFKLLVHKDFVNAKLKTLPIVDYSNIKNGFICINEKPKSENNLTQEQANSLFIKFMQLLASMNAEEVKSIENDEDTLLYNTIQMVKKEKNLLFFLPCIINTKGSAVTMTISIFLSGLFSLRDQINRDTFITLLSEDDNFYILKYFNGKFSCVDKVHKIFMSSFRDIYRLTYISEEN